MMIENRNYLIEAAAEYLRLPIPTIRKFRSEIGGAKLGRRWIFSQNELDSFVESKRCKPERELQKL